MPTAAEKKAQQEQEALARLAQSTMAQTPEEALAQRDAEIAALREQLEQAQAAASSPAASAAEGATVVDVLGALLDRIEQLPQAQKAPDPTFRAGETPREVWQSLENSLEDGYLGRKLERPIVFKSRGKNAVVLQKARHRYHDTAGNMVVIPGRQANFAPSGEFVTDDEGMVQHLMGRPAYGSEFWKVGEEPFRVPEAGPLLDRVLEATIRMDVSALDKIEHEEADGYKRPAVMEAIEAARRQIARRVSDVTEFEDVIA